jgi:predicted ATPase/DNA-binding CsgD family transcriptional regulator
MVAPGKVADTRHTEVTAGQALEGTERVGLTVRGATHNLPVHLTSFVGREHEIQQVRGLLNEARLLTLTGSGGCGKTRLAIQVATGLLDDYADGVWFVDLVPVISETAIILAVASTLSVRDEGSRELIETVSAQLRDREVLLILDNCEHVAAASAQLADALLQACPRLRILATSREILNVPGELTYRVPSLSLPDASTRDPSSLRRSEATRLFVERGRFHQPGFDLNAENAAAVAGVCRALDGMPLALELAAARVGVIPIGEIEARLEDRFRLLTDGARTLRPRHQTLWGAIDWSYALLPDGEKRLFRWLSVFAGGFTAESASAVCLSRADAAEALLQLGRLVAKSMVLADERRKRARYRLLESLREYGRERLAAAGEAQPASRRQLDHFVQYAEVAAAEMHGPRQREWLDRLEDEQDNIRAAIHWGRQNDGELAYRLAAAMANYWDRRGHWNEGRELLAAVLQSPSAPRSKSAKASTLMAAGSIGLQLGSPTTTASSLESALALFSELEDLRGMGWAQNQLGMMEHDQANHVRSREHYEASLALARQCRDRALTAAAILGIGKADLEEGRHDAARARFQESLAISEKIGDLWQIAFAHDNLGHAALKQGKYARARFHHERSLAVWQEVLDDWGMEHAYSNLGLVALEEGDLPRGQEVFEENLRLVQRRGNRETIAMAHQGLGHVAFLKRDYASARWQYAQSLTVFSELRSPPDVAIALLGFVRIAWARSQPGRALRLAGAIAEMYAGFHGPASRVRALDVTPMIESCRQALGRGAAAAWEDGRSMTVDQAIAFAQESEPSSIAAPKPATLGGLTRREREIAIMVARGMTNRQIAGTLVISERTAEGHVERIRNKLGFHNRAEIAAWASKLGLVAETGR